MQGTIIAVDPNSKTTKTGNTYYRVQLAGGEWLSVYNKYNVGDDITYDAGSIPGWPRNVQKVTSGDGAAKETRTHQTKSFGPTEYETLLSTVVAIAKRQGITDHQAIAALNNTLIISLQKKGVNVDVESFVF